MSMNIQVSDPLRTTTSLARSLVRIVIVGHVISLVSSPAGTCRRLRARIFWLHQAPLEVGARILVRIGTAESAGVVRAIGNTIDPGQVECIDARSIAQNHVGEIEISLVRPLATDLYTDNPTTGRVVLEFDGRIAGGGLVLALDPKSLASEIGYLSNPAAAAKLPAVSNKSDLLDHAERLNGLLGKQSAGERLLQLRRDIDGRIVFTTSFGLEDQVITHLLWQHKIDVEVVTLDTGRLFEETYAVWAKTEQRYGLRIRGYSPRRSDLEDVIARHGINGFYDSKTARLACCHVRKVEPLGRALSDAKAWITGLRSEQSANRRDMRIVSAETSRRLLKLNPLFDWTRSEVLSFASRNDIPLNALHAKGFPSIGCAPCTRAIGPDEPERAGRWWWEDQDKKECGLHVAERQVPV